MSAVLKLEKIPALKIILPALLALGLLFAVAGFIFNLPSYVEVLGTKVSYPTSHEFNIYDRLLKRYAKKGLIDYATLKNDPDLKASYLDLKQCSPEHLQGKLEQLAYWINAYNLLTIKCISDSYPIEKLGQESALKTFIVGGKVYSLNQIKDDVLPPLINTSDWRAIFLVCNGSISAPFIADHAYSASRISDDLDSATKKFVLSEANYAIDEKNKMFSISPFYRNNLRVIDNVYPSPFDMVNDLLPRNKQVNLDDSFRNYARPYDWRINDSAWLARLQNVTGGAEKAKNQDDSESPSNADVSISDKVVKINNRPVSITNSSNEESKDKK